MKQQIMTGNLKKDYARFCFSCVTNLLVFSLYSIVDGLFVGRLVGQDALAAVDLCMPTLNILYFVGITMAVGSGVLIATELGAGRGKSASRIFSQNFFFTVLFGVLFTLLGMFFMEPFSRFLGADERTAGIVQDYLGTLAPFFTFIITEYTLETLIKVQGSPLLSVFTVTGTCLLNIFNDWLFIGPLDMGVKGAALATGISHMLATCIFLGRIIFSKKGEFHFTVFLPKIRNTLRAFGLGIADGSVEICSAVMLWAYNRLIQQSLGADGVAAFSVITFAAVLVENVIIGVSQGTEPLISYSRGAGRENDIRKILKMGLVTGGVVGLIFCILTEVLAPDIGALFLERGSEAWNISQRILKAYALGFLAIWANLIIGGYMSAIQKPGQALMIGLGRTVVIHLGLMVIVFYLFGIEAMWYCSPVAELIVAVISFLLVKKTKIEKYEH